MCSIDYHLVVNSPRKTTFHQRGSCRHPGPVIWSNLQLEVESGIPSPDSPIESFSDSLVFPPVGRLRNSQRTWALIFFTILTYLLSILLVADMARLAYWTTGKCPNGNICNLVHVDLSDIRLNPSTHSPSFLPQPSDAPLQSDSVISSRFFLPPSSFTPGFQQTPIQGHVSYYHQCFGTLITPTSTTGGESNGAEMCSERSTDNRSIAKEDEPDSYDDEITTEESEGQAISRMPSYRRYSISHPVSAVVEREYDIMAIKRATRRARSEVSQRYDCSFPNRASPCG